MKKILAILALIVTIASSESFAQGSATAAVNLSIQSSITLTKVRDLAFPNTVVGITAVSVDPVTGGAAAAYFTLLANASTPVTVTFSSLPLTSSGNPSIPFTGTLSGGSTTTQSSSTSIVSGNTVTTDGTGHYYFWAGGNATPSATQPAANYAGSFTLNVAY